MDGGGVHVIFLVAATLSITVPQSRRGAGPWEVLAVFSASAHDVPVLLEGLTSQGFTQASFTGIKLTKQNVFQFGLCSGFGFIPHFSFDYYILI